MPSREPTNKESTITATTKDLMTTTMLTSSTLTRTQETSYATGIIWLWNSQCVAN